MYPYGMPDPQNYANEQAMLQNRINQLEQQRNQQMGMYSNQMRQPQGPVQNVNWIQVAGVEGAKNQIVQPGQTTWMMDNNSPMFYIKSVDGMGSATLKAFQFQEIPVNALTAPQVQQAPAGDYVTREEFNSLLARLGEKPSEKEESHE